MRAINRKILPIILCVLVLLSTLTLPIAVATTPVEIYGYIHIDDGDYVTQLPNHPITIRNDLNGFVQDVFTDQFGFFGLVNMVPSSSIGIDTYTITATYYDPNTQNMIFGSTTMIISPFMRADPTFVLSSQECEWYEDTAAPSSQYPPHSDETVIDIYFSQEFAFEGDVVTISSEVMNIGDTDLTQFTTMNFFDGDNPILPENIIVLPLDQGQTNLVEIVWIAGSSGEHLISAEVGREKSFAEVNMQNNLRSENFLVLTYWGDYDFDGLNNWHEYSTIGTSPIIPDSDVDGLWDGWQEVIPDGIFDPDGVDNIIGTIDDELPGETQYGTDPLDITNGTLMVTDNNGITHRVWQKWVIDRWGIFYLNNNFGSLDINDQENPSIRALSMNIPDISSTGSLYPRIFIDEMTGMLSVIWYEIFSQNELNMYGAISRNSGAGWFKLTTRSDADNYFDFVSVANPMDAIFYIGPDFFMTTHDDGMSSWELINLLILLLLIGQVIDDPDPFYSPEDIYPITTTVHFWEESDTASPIAWDWDFGDAYGKAYTPTADHIYLYPGIKIARLTMVFGPFDLGDETGGGIESPYPVFLVRTTLFEVPVNPPDGGDPHPPPTPPTADFTYYPVLEGGLLIEKEGIQFEDQSTGEVDYRIWIFGDGHVSRQEDPIHMYQYPGTFKVTLLVGNKGGWDTKSEDVTVEMDLTIKHPDTDGDGLYDEEEFFLGTNPTLRDSDGDGLWDGWRDTGTDGLLSEEEPGYDPVTNPDPSDDDFDPDSNSDGKERNSVFDTGEVKGEKGESHSPYAGGYGTDPRYPDSDRDGLVDGWEDGFFDYDLGFLNIRAQGDGTWSAGEKKGEVGDEAHGGGGYGTYPNEEDTDGDGLWDGWNDNGPDGTPDSDDLGEENGEFDSGEAWGEIGDPDSGQGGYGTDPKPGGADTDSDGLDDGAEVTYWDVTHNTDWPSGETTTWDSNSDGSGPVNLLDSDSDNDDLLDGAEVNTHSTDPADPDTDDDDLLDGWEIKYDPDDDPANNIGLNPNSIDTDGDGTDDDVEDFDSDGLLNSVEQTEKTDPDDDDTDDDGLDDGWEVNGDFWEGVFNQDKKDLWDELDGYGHAPDPTKKDIYIEMDWMEEGPTQTQTIGPTTCDLIDIFIVDGEYIPLYGISHNPGGGSDYDFYIFDEDSNQLTVEENDGVYILTEDFSTTTTEPSDAHYIYLESNSGALWYIEYFNDFAHQPDSDALQDIIDAFDDQDIILHIDDGDMGGGTEVTHQTSETFTYPDDWDDYYDDHFLLYSDSSDSHRQNVFHYALMAHSKEPGSSLYGEGEVAGDMLVLYFINRVDRDFQANRFMHEFGHNILGTIDTSHQSSESDDPQKTIHCNDNTCAMWWIEQDTANKDYCDDCWAEIERDGPLGI
ncbi:MAG: hypothetical protein JSW00_04800 [Thermoplasmata archaeon]|nr:MAG: hypothetical protein JSW00_04800 [Thermoplasmata archaeon]